MSDRLSPFSTEELSALLFSLDFAATVEPLVPEAERIRRELVEELERRNIEILTDRPKTRPCQDRIGLDVRSWMTYSLY
ncbi:MAG TPA: hypothetical protein VJX28_04415 [Chthoniobacterales bacterium]|nr:hypothetical protein [Chthoniobacterales bacterium]